MDRKENMIRLKEKGYSYGSIGDLYGISRQRVHQLISGYGILRKRLYRKNGEYWRTHNAILLRDNYECQKCGNTNNNLIVHHIDGNDYNNTFDNLITLCNNCHLNLHRPSANHKHTPGRVFENVKQ